MHVALYPCRFETCRFVGMSLCNPFHKQIPCQPMALDALEGPYACRFVGMSLCNPFHKQIPCQPMALDALEGPYACRFVGMSL